MEEKASNQYIQLRKSEEGRSLQINRQCHNQVAAVGLVDYVE